MDFKLKTKEVIFKDSDDQEIGRLIVTAPTLAHDQTRAEMEEIAEAFNLLEAAELGEKITAHQIKRQSFRVDIYPKLAACSAGDIPDEDTAFTMPAAEMYKWYDAAHECAPDWFRIFDEIAAAYKKSKAAGDAAKKKKGKRQRKSSPALKSR